MVDPGTGASAHAAVYARAGLMPGDVLTGPAVVTEDGTSTIVPSGYALLVATSGALVITLAGAEA